MEIEDIYRLIEQFDHSCAAELELEFHGMMIHIRKPEEVSISTDAAHPLAEMELSERNGQKSEQHSEKKEGKKKEYRELRAPLAGTFYRAASPDAQPFVNEGDTVRKGTVIGIIEAMKMMNEVTVNEDGIIEKILPKDGTLVAFDEVLCLLQ